MLHASPMCGRARRASREKMSCQTGDRNRTLLLTLLLLESMSATTGRGPEGGVGNQLLAPIRSRTVGATRNHQAEASPEDWRVVGTASAGSQASGVMTTERW